MKNLRIGQELSLPILALTVFNITTLYTKNSSLSYYLLYITFSLVTIIPLNIIKKEIINKTSVSWLLFVLSLVVQYLGDPDDLTGISLFMLSLSISPKSRIYYIVYISLFAPLLIYKSNIFNVAPSQLMAFLCGIWFVAIIYKRYIHPIKENEYTADYSNTVIEKIYIDIITLYINGYSWSKISSELSLNVTGKSVQRTLDKYWRGKKFKNREQFAHYMGQMGIIKAIDKNLITE